MAEIKEENERAVFKKTLEEIIEKINENIRKTNPQHEIIVNDGKSIGILTFNKQKEAQKKELFSISMTIDGKNAYYVYDDTGDNIAVVEPRERKVTVEVDDDIEIDQNELVERMNLPRGFQNDNQGRHIADKQEKVITAEEKQEQKNDIDNNKTLTNLLDMDISVDSSAAIIDLYRTIYNGRRLRDLLGIDEKLRDRMPQGANIEHMNFLGVVNSANLISMKCNLHTVLVCISLITNQLNYFPSICLLSAYPLGWSTGPHPSPAYLLEAFLIHLNELFILNSNNYYMASKYALFVIDLFIHVLLYTGF